MLQWVENKCPQRFSNKVDLKFSFISYRIVQVGINIFQFRFHPVHLLTVAKME